MINFKRISALILALIMLASFASCGKGDNTATTVPATMVIEGETVPPMDIPDIDRGEEKINVAVADEYANIPFFTLATDRSYAYNIVMDGVTSASAAEKLKNGEADVAVVSLEDASKLTADANFRVLAVNSMVKVSIVENGDTIKNIDGLKGKTIYCGVEDEASQAVTKAIFADNDMSVDLIFASVAEVEEKMKNEEITVCIFSEPDATRIAAENETFAKRADLTAGWKKDFTPVQSCIVVNAAYAQANPDKINEFIDHTEMAVNYVIGESGVGAVALQLAENGDVAEAELIRDMINADGLVYIDGEEMQTQVNAYCDFLAKKGVEITAPQF